MLHNIRSTPTNVDPKLYFHTMHSFWSCAINAVSRRSATKQVGTASRCRDALCTRRVHRLPRTCWLSPGSSVPSGERKLHVAGGKDAQDLVVWSMYTSVQPSRRAQVKSSLDTASATLALDSTLSNSTNPARRESRRPRSCR